jgi:YVTN family beta-propeller protein
MGSDNRVPHVRTSADVPAKISVLVVALLALLASGGCGGGSTNANGGGGGSVAAKVTGTIAVGTAPNAIAVDSTTNKIYVADFGKEDNNGICQTCYCPVVNGTLTVIDGATQSPTTTGFSYTYSNPLDLAVIPANNTLYVASRVFFTISPTCGYTDNVAVLASATLTQTTTTYVGSAHAGAQIAVNQSTGNVYSADWSDGTVTVLDASGNVLDTINLPTRPTALAVNTTTNKIYVATNECPTCIDPVSNNIIVIDGATNQVVTTITDANAADPSSVAVNPISDTIYVTNGQSNNLTVIDGASDSVSATLPAGLSPSSVAVDPQTNFIYIANAGNYDFNQHGSVTIIDGSTNAATTLTDSNMPYPFRDAVNTTTNKVYVASILSNNVTIIDGAHE